MVRSIVLSMTLMLFSASVLAQGGLLPLSEKEIEIMKTEGKRLWQKRDVKESLEEALSKFELAFDANKKDAELAQYLIRGYYILGDGHEENKDLKIKAFEKAVAIGDAVLEQNEEYAKTLKKKDIESAVEKLTVDQVPVMFWTAASLGKFARANGIFSSMKHKSKIQSLVKQVEKLKPDYFHGSVPRYWGGYYAVAPGIAGGDMKKSKKYFEQSLAMAPEYLGTKVLMADVYYTKKGDKKEFKKILLEVIGDKSNHPELGPDNAIERKKAEKLLEQEDKLF